MNAWQGGCRGLQTLAGNQYLPDVRLCAGDSRAVPEGIPTLSLAFLNKPFFGGGSRY